MILKYEKEYKNGKLLNIKEYVLNKKSIKNNIIIEGKGIINEYDDKEKLKFYNEEIIKGNKYYNDIKIEKEYRNGKLWNVKEYDKNSNIINEIKVDIIKNTINHLENYYLKEII